MPIINVTQENIDKGKRFASCSCPVALALKNAGYQKVSVTGPVVCIGTGYRWKVTPEIYTFIIGFDGGMKVKPFTFELPATDKFNFSLPQPSIFQKDL